MLYYSAACSIGILQGQHALLENSDKATKVIITALGECDEASTGTVVTFRGASVDGKWYNQAILLLTVNGLKTRKIRRLHGTQACQNGP